MSSQSTFTWESSSRTDVGSVREINEDACLARPEIGLWVVADGMGGHSAGDLASGSIVDTLAGVATPERLSDFTAEVEAAPAGYQRQTSGDGEPRGSSNHRQHRSLPCSLTTGTASVNGLGDSRIYRFRDERLEQLTQDHALVEELVEKGVLSPEEAAGHPQSNLVTRAVGATERLYVDAEIFELAHDDCFVLCSDGLDKELAEEDIAHIVAAEPIEQMSNALVDLALERGARDNVTVVCVRVLMNSLGLPRLETERELEKFDA